MFGTEAAIQRCTLHKRRMSQVSRRTRRGLWVDAKLVEAVTQPNPKTGLANANSLAAQPDETHSSAAASLREGLEETFPVARLGIDGRLAKTPTTANPIESMSSTARTTTRKVTRWRDRQMVLRWTAAGMLNAAGSFRRIKRYKQMPDMLGSCPRLVLVLSAASVQRSWTPGWGVLCARSTAYRWASPTGQRPGLPRRPGSPADRTVGVVGRDPGLVGNRANALATTSLTANPSE